MRKIIGYTAFWLFVASVANTIWALSVYNRSFLVTLPLSFLLGHYVFKGTMNLVQGVGFIYWVTRDTHKGFSLSIGFMRETDYPWRTGRGLQIGIGKYVSQFGICKRNKPQNEIMGLTMAVKGRELQHKPKEIREWR
jgi:hypothetical protein